MAPRRRPGAPSATSTSNALTALARRHGLSTPQASSIHESFSLFAVRHPSYSSEASGVLKRQDVRRCLIALGVTPSSEDLPGILDSLDPEDEGFVTFEPFLEVAGLYLSQQEDDNDDGGGEESGLSSPPEDLDDDDDDDGDFGGSGGRGKVKKRKAAAAPREPKAKKGKQRAAAVVATTQEEIEDAFALFTKGGAGPITLQHLKRVARELREDVSDEVLRDMILEANGEGGAEGRGKEGWRKGVAIEEFEGVLRRAGVFG